MQELPTVTPGTLVRARATSWIVEGVERGADDVVAVDLTSHDGNRAGLRRTLLTPFDDVLPLAAPRIRRVSEGTGLALLCERLAAHVPWPAPEVAIDARIDLRAHQLSAAMALRSGRASRVLVSDPVGSGKTISAALAVADLLTRAPDSRVLLAVPAGLVGQWRDELATRFDVPVEIADGNAVLGRQGVDALHDPWAGPGVWLSSFDFLKRPEVAGALRGHTWDLLVVDEAHHAAHHTQRRGALDALGRRSRTVLLLTATPHDGDGAAFEALCGLGAHVPADDLLVLRRPRADGTPHGRRRDHRVTIALSREEGHLRDLLARYLAALEGADAVAPGVASLIAAVLEKRVASSAFALRRSVLRRARTLDDTVPAPAQPSLPIGVPLTSDDDAGDDAVLDRPAGLSARHERAWLGAIASAALAALRTCPRVRRLRRLAARLREPLIVFTEYRDTLTWLDAALRSVGTLGHLHGGQAPAERTRQLEAFAAGRVRVLLATDAASEGLNLQMTCRTVVQFDTPWTPMRAEQRIGRVDRLGQRRRVHAWHFTSDHVIDERLSASLGHRTARVASAMSAHLTPDDSAGDERCLAHLQVARELRSRIAAGAAVTGETARAVGVAWLRPRRSLALGLGPNDALVVVESVHATGTGERLERLMTAVRCQLVRPERRQVWRRLPLILARAALEHAEPHVSARRHALERVHVHRRLARLARESAILRERARDLAMSFAQPGLFDKASPTADAASATDDDGTVRTASRVVLLLLPRGWCVETRS